MCNKHTELLNDLHFHEGPASTATDTLNVRIRSSSRLFCRILRSSPLSNLSHTASYPSPRVPQTPFSTRLRTYRRYKHQQLDQRTLLLDWTWFTCRTLLAVQPHQTKASSASFAFAPFFELLHDEYSYWWRSSPLGEHGNTGLAGLETLRCSQGVRFVGVWSVGLHRRLFDSS